MEWIDLRSDTVTHPTPEMRRAMAEAEVGDDVYGDDPSVNRLQEMAAVRLGKQAGLFVPSGTMGNLAAALAHCQRGDEVILGDRAHIFLNEAGGFAAVGGLHPRPVANRPNGELPFQEIEAAIRGDDAHFPPTRMICLENTHNWWYGEAISLAYTRQVGELANAHGLKLHLDGARIFNAAASLGVAASELAAPADSVTFCLSKALCAPVGSVLCGTFEFIYAAHRMRKQLGGGMRQAGVLAAAGIVALETMVDRLVDDHRRARALATGLQGIDGLTVENPEPASNMVYIGFDEHGSINAEEAMRRLARRGIKVVPRSVRRMRLVTHYWTDDDSVNQVVEAFTTIMNR